MSDRAESVLNWKGTGIPTDAHSVKAPWTMPTYAGSHPSRCVAGWTQTLSGRPSRLGQRATFESRLSRISAMYVPASASRRRSRTLGSSRRSAGARRRPSARLARATVPSMLWIWGPTCATAALSRPAHPQAPNTSAASASDGQIEVAKRVLAGMGRFIAAGPAATGGCASLRRGRQERRAAGGERGGRPPEGHVDRPRENGDFGAGQEGRELLGDTDRHYVELAMNDECGAPEGTEQRPPVVALATQTARDCGAGHTGRPWGAEEGRQVAVGEPGRVKCSRISALDVGVPGCELFRRESGEDRAFGRPEPGEGAL